MSLVAETNNTEALRTKIAFTEDVAFSRYFKGSTNRPGLISDEVVSF